MRSAISGVLSMISTAGDAALAARAAHQALRDQRLRFSERSISSCSRRSSGKKLMMRSSAWLAAVGVQRGKHQVAGLGELDAVLHGFAFADLADQDHVRRLAQRVLQRRVPGLGVHADFAVGDHAALVRMHVLDRVLDGDDVTAGIARCDSRPSRQAWWTCPSRSPPTRCTRPRLAMHDFL